MNAIQTLKYRSKGKPLCADFDSRWIGELMRTMIETFINGNLSDAKARAKRHSWQAIYKALRNEYGWNEQKSRCAADYLKGQGNFQAYCDAE